MNKTIITTLLALVALAGQGQQNGQSGGYSNDPLIEKLATIAEIIREKPSSHNHHFIHAFRQHWLHTLR